MNGGFKAQMQLFTFVYLLAKCPAIEGFWTRGMEGISRIQQEARGISLLSCGKKIVYWQAALFDPPKSCIYYLNLRRKILDDAEIDINEAANGVFLPKESKYVIGDAVAHTKVHTNRYYDALYGRLKDIQKDKIRNELKKISDELLNGTFPY